MYLINIYRYDILLNKFRLVTAMHRNGPLPQVTYIVVDNHLCPGTGFLIVVDENVAIDSELGIGWVRRMVRDSGGTIARYRSHIRSVILRRYWMTKGIRFQMNQIFRPQAEY